MTELEEATQLLGRLVDQSLQSSFTEDVVTEPPAEEPSLPVGQYL